MNDDNAKDEKWVTLIDDRLGKSEGYWYKRKLSVLIIDIGGEGQ